MKQDGILGRKIKAFKIVKLKEDYDGDSKLERMFFNGLFSIRSVKSSSVTMAELRNKFYEIAHEIEMEMENNLEDKIWKNLEEKIGIIYLVVTLVIVFLVALQMLTDAMRTSWHESNFISISNSSRR